MNIISIISLLACSYSVVIGFFIFYKLPNSKLSQMFLLMSLAIGLLGFSQFQMRIADDLQTAWLWSKVYAIWPLVLVFSVHFVLTLNTNTRRSLFFFILLYIPGIIFSYLHLSTDLVALKPVYKYWGWSIQHAEGIVHDLTIAFGIIVWIILISVSFYYYKKFKGIARVQSLLIFIAFCVDLIVVLITDLAFPLLHIEVPELSSVVQVLPLSIIAFSILNYDLYSLNEGTLTNKLFNSINNYLILVDGNRKILEINQSLLKKLNYSRDDLIGEDFDTILDFSINNANPLSCHIIKSTEFNKKEINVRSKNNEVIPLLFSSSFIQLTKKMKPGLIYFGVDEKIKLKNKVYRFDKIEQIDFLAETALDLVQLKTKKEVYNYVSDRIYNLLNKTVIVVCSEYKIKDIHNHWKIQSISGISNKLNDIFKILGFDIYSLETKSNSKYYDVIKSGKLSSIKFEFSKMTNGRISDSTGRRINRIFGINGLKVISISHGKNSYGAIAISTTKKTPIINKGLIESFVAIVSLVLHRQHSEVELAKTAKLFSAIVENSQVSIFIVDKKRNVLLVEGKNINKFRLISKNVVGQTANDFLMKFPEAEKLLNRALLGESFETEIMFQNTYSFKVIFSPYMDENENLLGTLIMADDITKRIIAKEKMNELNKMQTKLFSVIGHDLRSPIANILSFSKLMLGDFKSLNSRQLNKYVNIVQKSANNSFNILNSLLEWSRSVGQNSSIKFEIVCLNERVNIALKQVYNHANKKEIEILNKIHLQDCIMADKNMMLTVIRNLLSNAIKFTNPGGRIIINVERKKQFLELSISDNGIGMIDDKLNNLFEFNCEKTSRGTAGERGSGLGLQICKDFVEKNGGKLNVKSKINEGSVFTIIFPVVNERIKDKQLQLINSLN